MYISSLNFSIIFILSAVVLIGITVADANTRKIGFTDMPPVMNIEKNDDGVAVSIMDSNFRVSNDILSVIEFVIDVYKQAVPSEVKASSALIEIIETIAGQFVR